MPEEVIEVEEVSIEPGGGNDDDHGTPEPEPTGEPAGEPEPTPEPEPTDGEPGDSTGGAVPDLSHPAGDGDPVHPEGLEAPPTNQASRGWRRHYPAYRRRGASSPTPGPAA